MIKAPLSTDLRGVYATRQFLDQAEQAKRLMGFGNDGFNSVRDFLRTNDRVFEEANNVAKLVRDMDGGWRHSIANSVKGVVDAHQRMFEAAAGPLLRLRADTLYEDQIKRVTAALGGPLGGMFKDIARTAACSTGCRALS
jgi:hypothetical protein